MTGIIKSIIIVGMVLFAAYFGACVYANFFHDSDNSAGVSVPVDKAKYEVTIINTHHILYSNKVVYDSGKFGLYGYWEQGNAGYEYHDREIILDESVFGKIKVRLRDNGKY